MINEAPQPPTITRYVIMRPDQTTMVGKTIAGTPDEAKQKMERWTLFPWSHSRLRGYKVARLAITIVDMEEDF